MSQTEKILNFGMRCKVTQTSQYAKSSPWQKPFLLSRLCEFKHGPMAEVASVAAQALRMEMENSLHERYSARVEQSEKVLNFS